MDASLNELWLEMDKTVTALSNALDLVYVMYEAAWRDTIDNRKLSMALYVVWQHLCGIEADFVQLTDAAREPVPSSSDSAKAPQSATSKSSLHSSAATFRVSSSSPQSRITMR